MSSKEVVDFVRKRLSEAGTDNNCQPIDPEEICEQLINHCLAPDLIMGIGCDNMTVVLVCFLHGKSYSEMLHRCQKTPE
jgi:protein phosphatase 2C family protein 2/3